MSADFFDRISKLSPKRLALLALELNEQVEAAKARSHAPIAIVGMACRFPGAADLDGFWTLLREGRDAIRPVPRDRWNIDSYFDPDPDTPGRMSVRNGGFLDRVDGFDAAFFGITPREAMTMDPQQRLLLEVVWEALEHAGLAPDRLAGSSTGVFVGLCNSDHFQRLIQRGEDTIDAYLASGNAHSVAAGRIAYFLGLQGPALSIDTACSSSLVALHAACQSLRSGESSVALSGGVNVMCSPETSIALSKAHMLAPDGRCKTFDARADGFSRGEGCGVLVLKRLGDALAANDRVLAVIRGTAVNQDGRSGGLTVPNGPAQEAVIRAALADAGIPPAEVNYVEAHGTGTSLGDPIEVRALASALGQGRPAAAPLAIGSVKTNIGHLESAAGVAGVMKVVLALQHERIPPHLHFQTPSPHIAWSDYPVEVAAQGRPWPRSDRRRIAGVSSFGFSGTNAHVVIEEPPMTSEVTAERRPWHVLPLSARTNEALHSLGRQYADLLDRPRASLLDIAHTAGVGRSQFPERVAFVAADATSAADALRAAVADRPHPDVHRATAVPGRPLEVVFLFTGQGAQYPGMARDLYDASPVFRDVIDRCDVILGTDAAGRTLKSVLWSEAGDAAPIHETVWTQPALFAVEYGLTQLWRSWGVEPAAVMGHSVGEYVAACVAGVFSLEDGLRLIAERGRLMQALPPGGAMAAIFAPLADVAAAVEPLADSVSIAAINAADSVVVSGSAASVDALLADFERREIKGHTLFVSFAAHSPLVEPALDAMEACASRVTMRPPQIPVVWNLTGSTKLATAAPDASYWRRHLREPVRFADGLAHLYRDGYTTFLEVGPHPTLLALAQRTLPEQGALMLSSLRRNKDDWYELTTSLARLYVHGAPIDFANLDAPFGGRRIDAPTYPFERRSYWVTPSATEQRKTRGASSPHNGLRGVRLETAAPIFELTLAPNAPRYLAEHRVHGSVLVPGPVYMEIIQACARDCLGAQAWAIEDFSIHEPLVLSEAGRSVQAQLDVAPNSSEHGTRFSIHSRAIDVTGDWRLHATGRLVPAGNGPASGAAAPTDVHRTQTVAAADSCSGYYERLSGLGIELGPSFQSLRQSRRTGDHIVARIELSAECAGDAVSWVHPALLDGALQAIGLALPESADPDVYLLTGAARVSVVAPLPAQLFCEVRLHHSDEPRPRAHVADVVLRDDQGEYRGEIAGVSLRRTTREALRAAAGQIAPSNLFYRVEWEELPPAERAASALRDIPAIARDSSDRFESIASAHGLSIYEDLLPTLDRISLGHVARAFRDLGFDATSGRTFRIDDEARTLRIANRHRRLFARLVEILIEEGVLCRHDGWCEVTGPLPRIDAGQEDAAASRRFGAIDGELSTLRRCGPALARVLTGEQDPLHLLFPGGSLVEARQLYVESPYAKTYNTSLVEAVKAALATLPAGAKLRVLEIGAGTGGTTTYLLPMLAAHQVEYTFTDLSPLFLDRAAEQFAAYPFVRRALLDIERDPLEQGFQAGVYDIVIAANVLHATADLQVTLRHVRSLLAPRGLLFMLEGVAPERWVDLTFGLTDGWWRFTDTATRSAYPLINRTRWVDTLTAIGFADGTAIPQEGPRSRAERQQALILARAAAHPARWLLVGDDDEVTTAVSARLRQRGDHVNVTAADEVDRVGTDVDRVLYLGALPLAARHTDDEAALAASKEFACEVPLRLMAAAARSDVHSRLWLVTRGAQPVENSTAPGARWQAPLWGAGRVFALEQPSRWGGLMDLDPSMSAGTSADLLIAAIDGDDGEDQIAWRSGRRLAARLTAVSPPQAARMRLRSDATYLITGGFGGLGVVVAGWLAENGATNIALLGRSADGASEVVRALEARGTRVFALAGDVADDAAMTRLLALLDAQAPPLRGVVHAAADLSAAPIPDLAPSQISRMLRPKLDGTVVLERLTRGRALDFWINFSSTTALIGAGGLAHYAAANAFLDATAFARNQADGRLLSVNWGTWEVMRLASTDSQRSFRESGLRPMTATAALEALAAALQGHDAQAVIADIDWTVLKPLHEARRARPLLSRLGTVAPVRAQDSAPGAATLADRLVSVPQAARRDVILSFVAREVSAVLGLAPGDPVPLETGLFELGMDSLMSVELRRRLERGAGQPLPSTLTFNYPTVAALTAFIERQLHASLVPSQDPGVPSISPEPRASELEEDLDHLSDAEIESRLIARLEEAR
jgi:acyl transferase domain-containing protein/SAM-dependent methyltransferase/acyl carrier protein